MNNKGTPFTFITLELFQGPGTEPKSVTKDDPFTFFSQEILRTLGAHNFTPYDTGIIIIPILDEETESQRITYLKSCYWKMIELESWDSYCSAIEFQYILEDYILHTFKTFNGEITQLFAAQAIIYLMSGSSQECNLLSPSYDITSIEKSRSSCMTSLDSSSSGNVIQYKLEDCLRGLCLKQQYVQHRISSVYITKFKKILIR